MSMIDLNIKYRISNYTIRYFVRDLEQKIVIESKTSKRKIIICYTKDWQRIGIFESIKEALYFVNSQRQKEGKPIVDERNFYRTLKTACVKNGIASGYRWQYAEDVFYNGMQFNSSIDKQNYIAGLECECINNVWYAVKCNRSKETNKTKIQEALIVELYKDKTNKELAEIFDCSPDYIRIYLSKRGLKAKAIGDKNSRCIVCNKLGVYKEAMCNSCYNVKIKGKTPKPSKEQLIEDLKILSIKEIAEKYNRTPSTVQHWIINYNIRQAKTNDTFRKLVRCIELNLTLNTLREASKVVCKSDSNIIAYRIGQAAKSGKPYKGYHWEFINKQ